MRRPRKDQFELRANPTLHCVSRCCRQAFLLGRDPVTGVDHSHRRAWAVRRLRELATIFAIDVDTYAFLENHMHLLLTLRWDVAGAWAAEEVVDRWLRVAGRSLDDDERERRRRWLLARPDEVEARRERLCHTADLHKFLKQPLAVLANREDGVDGPFWAGRYGCFPVTDEAHRLAVMRYIDLNQVRAGAVDVPEASSYCGIRDRVLVAQEYTRVRDDRGRRRSAPKRHARSRSQEKRSKRQAARAANERARRDAVAELLHKRPQDLRHAEDGLWLTPIEPRDGRRGIFESLGLADYLRFVDAAGRRPAPGKCGAIDERMRPILERLGIDADRLERLDAQADRRPRGSVHGGPSACRDEAHRLGVRSIRPAFDVERRPDPASEPQRRHDRRAFGFGADEPFD